MGKANSRSLWAGQCPCEVLGFTGTGRGGEGNHVCVSVDLAQSFEDHRLNSYPRYLSILYYKAVQVNVPVMGQSRLDNLAFPPFALAPSATD